jgi:hypothetical protein
VHKKSAAAAAAAAYDHGDSTRASLSNGTCFQSHSRGISAAAIVGVGIQSGSGRPSRTRKPPASLARRARQPEHGRAACIQGGLPLDLCKFPFTFPFPNELIVPLVLFLFLFTIARYLFDELPPPLLLECESYHLASCYINFRLTRHPVSVQKHT